MLNPEEEKRIKEVFEECLNNNPKDSNNGGNLNDFRVVVGSFIRDIESKLDEAQALYELNSNTHEVKEKLNIISHYLSYVRRFCEGKIEGKYKI